MKPLVHRTLVHCNQRPRSAPNRAIGRQYFAAAYGLLGQTGMSDEAGSLVPEIAPVNVERARFRVIRKRTEAPSLRPVYVPATSPGPARPSHWRGCWTSSGAAGRDNFASDRPGKARRARDWGGPGRYRSAAGAWTRRRYVTSRRPCSCLSRENAQRCDCCVAI